MREKRKLRIIKIGVPLMAVILISSCSITPITIVVQPEKTVFWPSGKGEVALILARISGEAPKVGEATIDGMDILDSEPNRPFTRLAFLETSAPGDVSIGELLKDMKTKARSMGAEAIVLIESIGYKHKEELITTPTIYTPGLTMVSWNYPVLRGIAIKYGSN